MSAPPPAHRAGLTFRKLDLHVHTPASKDFGDKKVTAKALVEKALQCGLTGIGVTDHNSGAWVDTVKEAASEVGGLVVFPGVELTCQGGKAGIHVIALFDPSCGRVDVESLLGDLELRPNEYGEQTTIIQKTPQEVIETVHRRGGLATLAHANSTRGALSDMAGMQRTTLVRSPYLNAAEATDFQNVDLAKRRRRVVDWLDGTDPTYQRKLAVYQASDNPAGPGVSGEHGIEGIGTRCAFFKLDEVNIAGLRQCFADPDVRIRQDFEYKTAKYPRLKEVRVKGGFLDGIEAFFHEGLNSILGSKGAGKSLLVEFIRFTLDQPPINDEIRQDHDAKLESRLGDYGRVEVVVTDETGHDLHVTRVFDPAEDNPFDPPERHDVTRAFPVLFLSQNEIIRIAESEAEQLSFIDRFLDFRAFRSEIEALERRLEQLDAQFADTIRASQEAKDLEKAISGARAEQAKLDLALRNPVFDAYSKFEAKDRALREQLADVNDLERRLKAFQVEVKGIDAPAIAEELATDPLVRRASNGPKSARAVISTALEEAHEKVVAVVAKLQEDRQKWLPTFETGRANYADAVQKGGGDYKALAQKRAKTVKDLENLSRRFLPIRSKAEKIKAVVEERDSALHDIQAAYDRYSQERRARCGQIETESAGRLTVRLSDGSNVDTFRERLTSLKRGSHLRDADIETICRSVDASTFIRDVIRYGISRNPARLTELCKKIGIEAGRLQTLADFLTHEYRYEELLALEYKAMPQDRPEIRYNLGNGKYAPLSAISVGQKCTAMLLIAMSEGTMPVIVDQPEDSLDIRSIWEDICQKVRRGKEGRQFIFTTHSSSVAVASDTDKFIVLEGDATSGKVVFSGSMDHAPLSDQVIQYLEGGRQTYRAKYGKYGGKTIVD